MKLFTSIPGLRNSTRKKDVQNDDKSSRGKYGLVDDATSAAGGAKERKFVRIIPTLALLLAGIALMLAHHFFYSYLDSKIINPGASDLPLILRDQTVPNIIGAAIAHGACAVFSMIINSSFGQLFWKKLRSQSYSISQIDALAQSGRGPFHLSMFRTMTTAPIMFLISLAAASMGLVIVLSPGSLSVNSAFRRWEHCLVPAAPDLTKPQNVNYNGFGSFFDAVLEAGTYLPPFRTDVCAKGAQSCSYNISFAGPAFSCVDVSNQIDFAASLNSSEATSDDAPYPIYNGTTDSDSLSILVSTWDLANNVKQANNCTAYHAVYAVGVTLGVRSVDAHLQGIALDQDFPSTFVPPMNSFIDLALESLAATIFAGPFGFLLKSLPATPSFSTDELDVTLPNSGIFVTTSSGNHTWSGNMTHVLTSYMRNVSISLLSGGFDITVNGTSQNQLYIDSNCISTWDAYAYAPGRLLSIYVVALTFTLFIALPGIILTLHNGVEKVVLSNIIQFAMNSKLLRTFTDIVGRTEARAARCIPEDLGNNSERKEENNSESELSPRNVNGEQQIPNVPPNKWTSQETVILTHRQRLQNKLRACRSQMVILTSSGGLFMLLHHLYYSFLNTKPPGSSNSQARWITDQSVVSDIGRAIAYACQTCLGAAIATSFTQQLWRILRRRGHRIRQIDVLMKTQQSPFSLSLFRCARISLALTFVAFCSISTSYISTFAPNSIKLSIDQHQFTECTVASPRNLTSLETSVFSDYSLPLTKVFQSETYLLPQNPCSVDSGSQCNYSIEIVGPGFSCSDNTASSNYTAFEDANLFGSGPKLPGIVNAWSSTLAGDSANRTMRLTVQTWDVQGSVYRALDCSGVTRSYSLLITHNSSSNIEVISTKVLSPVLVDPGVNLSMSPSLGGGYQAFASSKLNGETTNVSFMQQYLLYIMGMLYGAYAYGSRENWSFTPAGSSLFYYPNVFFSRSEVGPYYIFDENMSEDLELFAQNATLSLLSGRIFAQNSPDGSEVLEDFNTTCSYIVTAYEYSPSRLFITYGVAIFVTTLCIIGGLHAIKRNGVDESMDFSRFLRAVSNERLFNVKERIEMGTTIKADDDDSGSFAPYINSDL